MKILPAAPFEEHALTWGELSALFRKHRMIILLVFLSGTLGTWAALQIFFSDQYESKVKFLVKIGRENTEVPPTVQNGTVLSPGVRRQDIQSEVEMLTSQTLVETVVDHFGPAAFRLELKPPERWWGYPKYYLRRGARQVKAAYKELLILANLKKRLTPREEAVLAVSNGLVVEPVKESDVLVMKVRLPSSKLCVDVANALAQAYLERRVPVRRLPGGMDFFDAQLAESQALLQSLQTRRAAVRDRWNISSPAEQRSLLLKELADLEKESVLREGEVAQLRTQQQLMDSNLQKLPSLVRKEQVDTQNPSIQSIKERLTSLRVDKAKLSSRYQPDSEAMRRLESEIVELEAMLSRENPTILANVTSESNPVTREFEKGLEQNQIKIAGLERLTQYLREPAARINSTISKVNRGSDAFESIDRQYRLAEQNYWIYAKRREEARISAELDARRVSNVAMMTPPETPLEPVYPRKLFIMAIALPVSLVLGLAMAGLLETLDDRIHTKRDLVVLAEVDCWEVLHYPSAHLPSANGKNGHWQMGSGLQRLLSRAKETIQVQEGPGNGPGLA